MITSLALLALSINAWVTYSIVRRQAKRIAILERLLHGMARDQVLFLNSQKVINDATFDALIHLQTPTKVGNLMHYKNKETDA